MIRINMCSIHTESNQQWNFCLSACLLNLVLPRKETGWSGFSCCQSVTSCVLLMHIPSVKILYFLNNFVWCWWTELALLISHSQTEASTVINRSVSVTFRVVGLFFNCTVKAYQSRYQEACIYKLPMHEPIGSGNRGPEGPWPLLNSRPLHRM